MNSEETQAARPSAYRTITSPASATNDTATASRTAELGELDRRLSAARLDHRLVGGSILLLLSVLAPYELVIGHPQFLWQVWGELGGVTRLAALAPSLAGLFLLVVWRFEPRPASRALFCFAGFAGVLVVTHLGTRASAWEALSVPELLGERPLLLLAPFACAGAGATLLGRGPEQRRRSRWLLYASGGLAVPLYLLPVNGGIPLVDIARLLLIGLTANDVRFMLGYGLIALTALLPLTVAVGAAVLAVFSPRQELVVVPLVMTYALPLALALFILREFLATLGSFSVVASVLNLLPLVAGLGLAAASLEVLVAGERPPRRQSWTAAGVLVALTGLTWVASRPPKKGVSWQLSPASESGDELFGDRLSAWNLARRAWGVREKAEQQASARHYVEVRKAANDLITGVRGVEPALVAPMSDLVFETRDLGLAGRRWFRLIAALNEASRSAGLPYYVDPTVDFVSRDGEVRLLFDLQPYRIEKVRPFSNGGRPLATLHVTSLGDKRRNHSLLGFSRDLQPFAIVALDVVRPYVAELETWAAAEPPTCFGLPDTPASGETAQDAPPSAEALAYCGSQLRTLRDGGLEGLVIASTERHELQHQIDGPELPLPTEVHDRMGPYFSWARDDVNRELSAQLAEMTVPGAAARLSLLQAFGNAYTGHPHGKYTHSSVLVLEALLGESLPGAGGSDRLRSRQVVAGAYRQLAALPARELVTRARRAWERLYGAELADPRPP